MQSIAPDDPRLRFAAERTMLAWIRTGLALMGFGFIVARFGMLLRELSLGHEQAPTNSGLSIWVGSFLIVLGVAVNLASAFQHARHLRRLKQGLALEPEKWSLSIVVSILLAAIGVFMTFYVALTAR